jgi:hypothetical protein
LFPDFSKRYQARMLESASRLAIAPKRRFGDGL